MSQVPEKHRAEAPKRLRCAVVTVSDTRTAETDRGGQTAVELLTGAGHEVTHREIIREYALLMGAGQVPSPPSPPPSP